MAILVNPKRLAAATAHKMEQWTHRHIAIKVGTQMYVNIYAPTKRADRECFFNDLAEIHGGTERMVLAGDFNCVENPARDRWQRIRRQHVATESPALSSLILTTQLLDVFDCLHDDGDTRTPT